MLNEFKQFLLKGNMIDMAVGFIFGAAFGTVIKSLVDNVIMPPVGMLMGGVDFSQMFYNLGDKEFATMELLDKAGAPAIKYGQFIQDTISFVILGFVLFMMIKAYNKLKAAEPEVADTEKVCGDCAMTIPVTAKKCGHCTSTNV